MRAWNFWVRNRKYSYHTKYCHMTHDISISKSQLFSLMVPKFKPSHMCYVLHFTAAVDKRGSVALLKALHVLLACYSIWTRPILFALSTSPPSTSLNISATGLSASKIAAALIRRSTITGKAKRVSSRHSPTRLSRHSIIRLCSCRSAREHARPTCSQHRTRVIANHSGW